MRERCVQELAKRVVDVFRFAAVFHIAPCVDGQHAAGVTRRVFLHIDDVVDTRVLAISIPLRIIRSRRVLIEDGRLVFGWASVAERTDGEQIVDWQEDIVEMPELEAAAYDFVQFYREGSEMHERGGFDIAILVESMVFTEEKLALLGIPAGTIPHGWWVGFRVIDDDVWAKVKDGTYRMFSIEGQAVREKV